MKKLLFFIFLMAPFALSASDDRFVDCGPGFVMASVPNRHGIPTVECRRLWCRDLENGRIMGRDATPSQGYENTPGGPSDRYTCDDQGNCIECFGRRRWCPGEPNGVWDPDLGFFVRWGTADANLYRSVLSGSCYRWQLQQHNCRQGEIAINNGDRWVCITQNIGGAEAARAAVRNQAVRRSAVMAPPGPMGDNRRR